MADIKPKKDAKPAIAVAAPAAAAKTATAAPVATPKSMPLAHASVAPAPAAKTVAPAPVAKSVPKPVAIAAEPVLVAPKVEPVPAKSELVAAKPIAAKLAPVVAAVAAAPAKAAEATRTIVEDTKSAVSRAADTVGKAVADTFKTPIETPKKGLLEMATSFDTKAFAPTPEAIKSMFGDIQAHAKTQMEKTSKIVEEMSAFAKGNVEAIMASGRVAAKGTETMAQEAADYGKKSLESATTAFKSFATAKSPTELLKLQSDYARSSFDAAVAEGSKLTEAWLKLAGEVAQPLSSRVAVAAEKIKTPLAA